MEIQKITPEDYEFIKYYLEALDSDCALILWQNLDEDNLIETLKLIIEPLLNKVEFNRALKLCDKYKWFYVKPKGLYDEYYLTMFNMIFLNKNLQYYFKFEYEND